MKGDGYQVIDATASHGDAILALMPRLADYDVPESRNPRHLWEHDAEMLPCLDAGRERMPRAGGCG